MLKQKYFLTDFFILSAEKQPIKLSWRNIEWLHYYLPCNVATYGGLCTVEYYENAIRYVRERYPQAVFYVFSDDLDWVRENIPSAGKMVFVDWNRGKDSWQDMFLMSKCHHNILANSSFSWWGAWLNTHPEKLVIAPERWANCPAPDALPDGWVRIEGVSRR